MFRQCGWLNKTELARCLPHLPGYTSDGSIRTALTFGAISLSSALKRTASFIVPLNLTMRIYGISNSRKRQTHFLAQLMLETDKWQTMEEYGRGKTISAIPMTQFYAAFYGRGVMQMTWASNYEIYGNYRTFSDETINYVDARITVTSSHYWEDPTLRDSKDKIIGLDPSKSSKRWSPRYDPNIINNPFNACDSGAFYWISKRHSKIININRFADGDFSTEKIGRISVLVNGGINGYFERQAYAQYTYRILNDDTENSTIVRFKTGKNNIQIDVNFSQPR